MKARRFFGAILLFLVVSASVAADNWSDWRPVTGQWKVTEEGTYAQTSGGDSLALLNIPDALEWTDYTLRCQAKKNGGNEGFLIDIKCGRYEKRISLNIGGWRNNLTAFQFIDGIRRQTPGVELGVETGRWYQIKIVAKGNHYQFFLDDECKLEVDIDGYPTGSIGLGSIGTQVEYKDITVTDPDGWPLYGKINGKRFNPAEKARYIIKKLGPVGEALQEEFKHLETDGIADEDEKFSEIYKRGENLAVKLKVFNQGIVNLENSIKSARDVLNLLCDKTAYAEFVKQIDRQIAADERKVVVMLEAKEAGRLTDKAVLDTIDADIKKTIAALFGKVCPKIAFIQRPVASRRGTNGTMFARYMGKGGAILVYDPARPQDGVKTIFQTDQGVIFDIDPSYDGKKLLYSYRETDSSAWGIWEIDINTGQRRQIVNDPAYHDFNPVYYPDGRIIFASSRVESYSLCQDFLACALYICDSDGSNIRRIDYTTLCSNEPSILPDGSIAFTRWEYQDKNIFSWQGLWTIYPDGRNLKLYYGNTLTIPNTLYGPKLIPDTGKVMITMAAHHYPPIGDIAIVDRRLGVENPAGMKQITFDTNYRVTKGVNWKDTNWGPGDQYHERAFTDPWPVTKYFSLVSYGGRWNLPLPHNQFKICMLLHAGQIVELYSEKDRSFYSPVSLDPRPLPHVIPGQIITKDGTGTFFVQDIYQGLLAQGVQRGEVKRLRIMRQIPKKYNTEGPRTHDHYPAIGYGNYYPKENLGTVPVDKNGAAYFKAPSNAELYFIAIDSKGREIQRMGSVVQITTGENASCVGCHENRLQSPPTVNINNLKRMAQEAGEITPPAWGAGPVDYVNHVQPVFDKHCIKCHSGPMPRPILIYPETKIASLICPIRTWLIRI